MDNFNYLLALANITITIIGVVSAVAALLTFFYLKRRLKQFTVTVEQLRSSLSSELYLIQEARTKLWLVIIVLIRMRWIKGLAYFSAR